MPNPYRFRSGESTGEAEKKTWCTNSSTSATGQLLKLQLFISSLWFKSIDRKWTKTTGGLKWGSLGERVFFFFFFINGDLQNVLNLNEQNLTIMFSSMIWNVPKSILSSNGRQSDHLFRVTWSMKLIYLHLTSHLEILLFSKSSKW